MKCACVYMGTPRLLCGHLVDLLSGDPRVPTLCEPCIYYLRDEGLDGDGDGGGSDKKVGKINACRYSIIY